MFENGNINRGCLVGDSVYLLKNYLLIFVLNLSNFYEEVYNDVNVKIRVLLSECLVILK